MGLGNGGPWLATKNTHATLGTLLSRSVRQYAKGLHVRQVHVHKTSKGRLSLMLFAVPQEESHIDKH